MPSDFTPYFGNKIVRWLGGNAMPSAPAGLFTALFNGNPKDGGVEVTEDVNSGGRLEATFTVPASGTTNSMASDTDVDYGNSESAVDITHIGIFDADTAGNLLASKALAAPQSVIIGTPVAFAAGDITFTVGSAL